MRWWNWRWRSWRKRNRSGVGEYNGGGGTMPFKSVPVVILAAVGAAAQPAAPAFEAATVKSSNANGSGMHWKSRPGYIVMNNYTLQGLMGVVYHVREDQVSGGPKWIDAERFDIEGRALGPVDDPELLRTLQTLLADRL